MRAVPFNKAGEYVFHLRRIPSGNMSLLLYAQGKTDSDREELTSLHTTLRSLLIDQKGNVICRASGATGDGPIDQIWVLMSGYSEAAFWQSNCLHVRLNSSSSYTLTLGVSDVDPKTPTVNLVPVLESDHQVWP
jgi:hypothetical protein